MKASWTIIKAVEKASALTVVPNLSLHEVADQHDCRGDNKYKQPTETVNECSQRRL